MTLLPRLIVSAVLLQAATPPISTRTVGPTDAPVRFRGLSAVSDTVAWASGNQGTIVRTVDGGETWQDMRIAGTAALDFRDIDAIDAVTAYVLSIGNGDASRIYKTIDAGETWTLQYINRDPNAFFDAMTFADATHGVVISDSVDGQFVILLTTDGGKTWTRAPRDGLPAALPNEGAFAASGSNIAMIGKTHIWIGTGAASSARVLRSTDGGRTWKAFATPLASGASAGIFSIAFRDTMHGVIVGGDYKKESDATDNLAVTSDGGVTWTLVREHGLSGFRSAVAYAPTTTPTLVAAGPTGADISHDDGRSWQALKIPGVHAFSFARHGTAGWGAGERGRIVRIEDIAAIH
jgi:photosystem II stability/assembly factor-like uncharacterized protein